MYTVNCKSRTEVLKKKYNQRAKTEEKMELYKILLKPKKRRKRVKDKKETEIKCNE